MKRTTGVYFSRCCWRAEWEDERQSQSFFTYTKKSHHRNSFSWEAGGQTTKSSNSIESKSYVPISSSIKYHTFYPLSSFYFTRRLLSFLLILRTILVSLSLVLCHLLSFSRILFRYFCVFVLLPVSCLSIQVCLLVQSWRVHGIRVIKILFFCVWPWTHTYFNSSTQVKKTTSRRWSLPLSASLCCIFLFM